jgi:hypothetical protein
MAYKPYPKMMYHETLQPKPVMNEDEMLDALKNGWSITRVDFNEAKVIRGRIAQMEKDLGILKMRLSAIESMNDIPNEEPKGPEPSPSPSKKIYTPKKKKGAKEE